MTTLVVLQPGYLPWLGFFDQMKRSDIFVYYDDVQFDKQGWRNRNRIKSPSGPHWLTVPVRHKNLDKTQILDIEIDNRSPWVRKQVGTIAQFYAKAPYLDQYLPELEDFLYQTWDRLVDLDLAVAELMCQWLGLKRKFVRASKLGIEGEKSSRLVAFCRHFSADRYLSGDSAKNYLDEDLFAANGIRVEWQCYQHPTYRQQHGEFIPYLSALDLLLNEGEASAAILSGSSLTEKR